MQASDVLPDHVDQASIGGITIRKGTVGAFLVNARVLGDPQSDAAARAEAQADIAAALPALRSLGLFDVFELRDATLRAWIEAQCMGGHAKEAQR